MYDHFFVYFTQNGGYNVRIDQIENCGGPQQILMVDTNTTVEMTEKCEIITIGCSTTSGFQKALVRKRIPKNIYSAHSLAIRFTGEIQHFEKRCSTVNWIGGFMQVVGQGRSRNTCHIADVRFAN